jgi:hypothetical protein
VALLLAQRHAAVRLDHLVDTDDQPTVPPAVAETFVQPLSGNISPFNGQRYSAVPEFLRGFFGCLDQLCANAAITFRLDDFQMGKQRNVGQVPAQLRFLGRIQPEIYGTNHPVTGPRHQELTSAFFLA